MSGAPTLPGFGIPEGRTYQRPTLREINDRPKNGRTAVSTFSGCGGSSLGLKMAGWSVPYAVEFIPAARETYMANNPGTYVDGRDIRGIEARDILERLRLEPGELDLFEGSPPCASFSMAGNRSKGWGGVHKYSDSEQRTDDLFFEWLRILDGLQPKALLAENVPGMVMGDAAGQYATRVIAEIEALGYRVAAEIVNSTWYGVPQARRRLIFLGYRRDLMPEKVYFPPASTDHPFTIREALESVTEDSDEHIAESWMGSYAVGRTWEAMKAAQLEGREFDTRLVPCGNCGKIVSEATGHKITEESADGRALKATCADGSSAVIIKDYFMLVIPELDQPSPTITATTAQVGAASVTHPTENRKLTPAELLAISGFPPDFILTGTRQQQCERIGRAVTPPLYEAVGKTIALELDKAES